jgi:DNA-binding IclR family transcriptional regulator
MRKRTAKSLGGRYHDGSAPGGPLLVALARGLEVLKAVGQAREPVGNAEIVDQTGLPKATVSRMTYTLAVSGYIDYIETLGRYRIGAGGVSLAYNALGGNVVTHIARPFMKTLSERLGLAVTVGIRAGFHMTYLATERGQDVFSLRLTPGSSIPIMSTSMGHGYLVSLNEDQRTALLRRLKKNTRQGWQKAHSVLRKNIDAYATVGYCSVVGLWHPHVNAVSAPFSPNDGSPTVVFSCGGLSNFAPDHRLTETIGPELVHLVHQVTEVLSRGTLLESKQSRGRSAQFTDVS